MDTITACKVASIARLCGLTAYPHQTREGRTVVYLGLEIWEEEPDAEEQARLEAEEWERWLDTIEAEPPEDSDPDGMPFSDHLHIYARATQRRR
ncbi:MAG: hypothetical protein IT318_20200 [Anaerolineales bacterium]|nr:hypothetical protein [Anaerolineales bacterium]